MSAALRVVDDVADHAGGAAQAQNALAHFRKDDAAEGPNLYLVAVLPCERCGRMKCDGEAAWHNYQMMLWGGASEEDADLAFERWVIACRACVPPPTMEFRPAIVFDNEGYVTGADNLDERYDLARERSKERM